MADPGVLAGVWLLGGDPRSARQLAGAGFDWLAVDLQHGRLDDAALRAVLDATDGAPANRWVRVRSADDGLIGRALDAGAGGVIVPMVDDAATAAAVVAAAHYPPVGRRSWGPMAGDYATPQTAPLVRVAVMIETAGAVAAVDDIAAVDGVDALFVGPFDLALSLGLPLDRLLAAEGGDAPLPRIVAAAERAGRIPAAFAGTPERARRLAELGFQMLAVATDGGLLADGARRALETVRSA